ncbi:hypothetical protein HRbin39_00962 [bacterium HR39]|nr:hypothetical protein HRbin39_00962 [bacterium HR39]
MSLRLARNPAMPGTDLGAAPGGRPAAFTLRIP